MDAGRYGTCLTSAAQRWVEDAENRLCRSLTELPAMSRALYRTAISVGRWACWMLVLVGLGLSGCQSWNLRGEQFAEDEFSSMPRRLRPFEPGSEAFGVSNKALQIERNLGFR